MRDATDCLRDSGHRRCWHLLANQSGWQISCPATVSVRWDGGNRIKAIEFDHHGPWSPDPHLWPSSQFGSGIVTFVPPFLFRTSPGYNLL
ncbi:MAG: DUF6065 family protein, partial [Mycobacterium sp.]